MSIDELINKLQELREEYGNKDVFYFFCNDGFKITDVYYIPEDEMYEDGFVIY